MLGGFYGRTSLTIVLPCKVTDWYRNRFGVVDVDAVSAAIFWEKDSMHRCISIIQAGFSDYETRLIKSILALASNGKRSYRFVDPSVEGCDLFIVNADNDRAVMHWRAYSLSCPDRPVIMVARHLNGDRGPLHYWVKWPIDAKSMIEVLNALDQHLIPSHAELNAGRFQSWMGLFNFNNPLDRLTKVKLAS